MTLVRVALCAPLLMLMAQTAGEPVVLQPLMKDVVAAQANALWDVGNNAMDDNGNPSEAKVGAAGWARLDTAARAMKAAAERMAGASAITVAAPGAKLQDDGAPGASTPVQIQTFIDADRAAFTERARDLVAISDELIMAAAKKDAALLGDASGRLDQVCEACHTKFWYPGQAAQ